VKHPRALAYLAFAIVSFVWGTTYLAIRVAIETLPTFLFAGLRFTGAGIVLLALCALRGEKIPRDWRFWREAAIVGFLMVGFGNIAVVWSEHYVSSGFAALLVAAAPFWMAIMERIRGAAQLSNRKRLGMLIGFAGVVILVWPHVGGDSFNLMFILGVIAIQIGSIAWNYGSIRSKYRPIDAPPLVSAAMQMLTGGALVTAIGLFRGEAPDFYFTTRTLAAFLYLLVFGSIVAYGAYVYALAHLPTSTVSLYAYINPVVAVFLGWLILSEPLGWNALVAMVVIFSGVALVQTGAKSKAAAADATLVDESQGATVVPLRVADVAEESAVRRART
jgi:drug/metabolite transporter (DMT)-like permease